MVIGDGVSVKLQDIYTKDGIPIKLQGVYLEKLLLADHKNCNNYKKSKLVQGLSIKEDDTILCPRCKSDNGCIEYGVVSYCKKCKLGLFVRCKDLYIFDNLEKNT